MKRMYDEFDDIFDRMFKSIVEANFDAGVKTQRKTRKFPISTIDDKKNVYITLSLGNVSKDDVFLTVNPDNVHIKVLTEEGEKEQLITLPEPVKPKSTESHFNKQTGTLDIEIRKAKR